MISRRNIFILGCLSAISITIYLLFSLLNEGAGFPLDDAWIHQTYARNISNGLGWSFTAGQASAGLTAPLWGLMLSLGHLLGLGPYIFTFFIGWLSLWTLAVTASIGFSLLLPSKENWALAAGILISVEWHLVWAAVSGMETLIFSLIVLLVLVLLFNNIIGGDKNYRLVLLGALVGISVWIRPEGLTLFGPIILVILLAGISWSEKLKKILSSFIGFGSIFILYIFFNKWLAGEWWPNTFYAKQAEYAIMKQIPLLKRIVEQLSLPLVGVGILLLPGFIYMIYIAMRKKQWSVLAAVAWTLGHLILFAIRLPVSYQHGRYAMPAMPIYFLVAFAGVVLLFQLKPEKLLSRVILKSWGVLIPLISLIFLFIGGNAYGRDVAFINTEMVDVAKWVSNNIPDEKLIAAHDIGALGYYSNRKIIDLAGLISPEVISIIRDEDQLEKFLDRKQVNYLITFPSWYPKLIAQREIIYQTEGNTSPLLGGENMVVYCWDCIGN